MAEHRALQGAHMAGMEECGLQPSIFDVLSQESLISSLKPAMGHVVKYLASSNPKRFAMAYRYYDELYALFDLWLQNHYLKCYGASFSENFYSMKRIVNGTGQSPTNGMERFRSLFVLVVLPYIRAKLDKLFERLSLKFRGRNKQNGESMSDRVARTFLAVYPWIQTVLNMWTLALQLGYVLSRTSIHSPFLKFAGVHLERLSPEDLARFGDNVPLHLQNTGFFSRLWRLFVSLPGVISRLFGYGLFFVQFLDFWYNSGLNEPLKSSSSSMVKIPPAPHPLLRESSVLLLETNKCPLCLRHRQNDTVLSVSGYVFCFNCISTFVKREHRCPVTSLPAKPDHLIRIFSSAQ